MTNELALMEDPSARSAQISRTDVLDHVRAIAQLPADAVVSFGVAADAFGVARQAVEQMVTRHLGEFVSLHAVVFSEAGDSNIVLSSPGRCAKKGLNRRGLLLLGMQVRLGNAVGDEIKGLLLHGFEVAKQAVTSGMVTRAEFDVLSSKIDALADAVKSLVRLDAPKPVAPPVNLAEETLAKLRLVLPAKSTAKAANSLDKALRNVQSYWATGVSPRDLAQVIAAEEFGTDLETLGLTGTDLIKEIDSHGIVSNGWRYPAVESGKIIRAMIRDRM
jgi:hypothetical protein